MTNTLVAALVLALTHVFAGKMRFLRAIPRSVWLSAASGISVAYVFLHLLPDLIARQDGLRRALGDMGGVLNREPVFVVTLAGLATFYGLERMAKLARKPDAGEDECDMPVFWIHIVSFAFYNALVGYLLPGVEGRGEVPLRFFTLAIAMHFLVNDYGLRDHFRQAYDRTGRWIVAAAVLVGWAIGTWTTMSPLVTTPLVAFLAGGVILNVLKEELPEHRKSRFSAFLLGMVAYSALILYAL